MNMKSFVVLCVFLISFCTIIQDGMCAAFLVLNATHPDYPERCFYNGSQLIILRKGEKKRYSKDCFIAECQKDYRILGTTCGSVASGSHCWVLKGDVSKPYPYCCDDIIC